MTILLTTLSSGYLHARGNGPCEWAQWPSNREPGDGDFFPEASVLFRRELAILLREQVAKAGLL